MKILWAITGAGHLLEESIDVLDEISEKHTITLATSKAAEEVIQLYGLKNKINEIINKNSENEYIKDEQQQYSYPLSGKLTHEKYDLIIISPTTANTTAKIVYGIADTLITNIAAQSGKGQIPLIVVPVDQKEGIIDTQIPPYIDRKECRKCEECIVKKICPENAINPPKIEKDKCTSCKLCKNKCPYNAVVTDKIIQLYIRKIDSENTKKLETIENITTIFEPYKIKKEIEKIE